MSGTIIGNNFITKDQLLQYYHIVQGSIMTYPKQIIISTLRDFFSHSSYYHFSKDSWGFPNITDHTNLPPGADLPFGPGARPDLNNSGSPHLPTRLFIGENYRFDSIFYPAILVKTGGGRYVPVSINRDETTIVYDQFPYQDGYGNSTIIHRPVAFETHGAYEGSIIVDIMTRSLRARDDLIERIFMCFTDVQFRTLYDVGLIVKPIEISSPMETDDRNDKLFKQTMTLPIRTEWNRHIPITSLVESIVFTATIGGGFPHEPAPDPTWPITTEVSLVDSLCHL